MDIQLDLVRRPWLGPPGVHPCLEGGPHFPDPLAVPVVCPSVRVPGLCGRLGSGVGPLQWKSLMDPAKWGSRGSCWHPSHTAPLGADRTNEALTKGDSTSFGPNPEICFPGSLFIELPSPHRGRSVIHSFQEFITLLLNLELAAVLIQSENSEPWGRLGIGFRVTASKRVSSGYPGDGLGGSGSPDLRFSGTLSQSCLGSFLTAGASVPWVAGGFTSLSPVALGEAAALGSVSFGFAFGGAA